MRGEAPSKGLRMEAEGYAQRVGTALRAPRRSILTTRLLRKAEFTVARLTYDDPGHGLSSALAPDNAFVLSLQLRDAVNACDLWIEGRPVPMMASRRGTTLLFDMNRQTIVNIRDPFDSLQFYVPRAALDAIAEDHGVPRIGSLHIAPGVMVDDETIRSLGAALLPALEKPEEANRLFLDHMAFALHAHLAHTYGDMPMGQLSRRGGLAPWQERRAKDLLMARLDGAISLEELATECGLSRSYFVRAFKKTMGQPPHRWLLRRRIEHARVLLGQPNLTIAEISHHLGFADESHFTRVFGKTLGVTPGAWRRLRGS